jgi:hypothetical protein
VPPARQQREAGARRVLVLGFAEDAPATGDNRIGRQDKAAVALARASRSTCCAGNSRASGVSSSSAGSILSGTMPIWRSNSSRRGEAEASTRIDIARG